MGKKRLVFISDFIEGKPDVASVRYEQLIKYISKEYYTVVISNNFNGKESSKYADINFKYDIISSKYTQYKEGKKDSDFKNKFTRFLRNPLFLFLWRTYSFSYINFVRKNKNRLSEISKFVENNDIDYIFVTVPQVYGLYVLKYIKRRNKNIPVIIEVRDIINNKLRDVNPTLNFILAEKIIKKYNDGLIALSEGIYDYYKPFRSKNIEIIKNGYSEEEFTGCVYRYFDINANRIVFCHIGTIYNHRNIKDFVRALIRLSDELNKTIVFNVIGYLDIEAKNDLEQLNDEINNSKNFIINILGTMPHTKAIQYLKESDFAVILTHIKGSNYAIPGKTFEYIGACKPIIAVTSDEYLINLVDGIYGECAKHNIDEIVSKLKVLINSKYDFTERFKFSRRNQAEKILNFINNLKI